MPHYLCTQIFRFGQMLLNLHAAPPLQLTAGREMVQPAKHRGTGSKPIHAVPCAVVIILTTLDWGKGPFGLGKFDSLKLLNPAKQASKQSS
jgi:hypothetical protein